MPLSVSGSVQGHFMNLDYWNKFTPAEQKKLLAEFKKMEDQMWALADTVNADAVNCNIGKEPCKEGVKFAASKLDFKLGKVAEFPASSTDLTAQLQEVRSGCDAVVREHPQHRYGGRDQHQQQSSARRGVPDICREAT